MSQWSNFLGSGVSVLELLLAALSVGGGGYIAGRASSLARMRTEDRRRLVDELLPGLRGQLNAYPDARMQWETDDNPPYCHPLESDVVGEVAFALRAGGWASRTLGEWREIRSVVERLSWRERRLAAPVEDELSSLLTESMEALHQVDLADEVEATLTHPGAVIDALLSPLPISARDRNAARSLNDPWSSIPVGRLSDMSNSFLIDRRSSSMKRWAVFFGWGRSGT